MKEMWQRLGQEYQGRLNVTVSESRYLEFLSPKVNKGRALSALMDMWQLQQDEVMAIGDSFNDLELLTSGPGCGHGQRSRPCERSKRILSPAPTAKMEWQWQLKNIF